MKICFISNNSIGEGFSGGERIYTELLKGWRRYGYTQLMGSEEAIRASQQRGVAAQFLQTSPANRHPRYGLFGLLLHTVQRLVAGIRSLTRFADELQDVTVVYSVSDFYPDFIPALLMKRRHPEMIWIAGFYLFAPQPWAKNSSYQGLNRVRGLIYWLMQVPSYYLINRYADKVFVTSEPDVKRFVTARRSVKDVIVVQGGVDITDSEAYLAQAPEAKTQEKRFDACFIGRLHYQKGVLILLDIWSRVCFLKPKARLAMIGDGPLEAHVREKIRLLGLTENVELLGFLDGAPKHAIFKQSKIMVHPATYDSGGMAAAEGMAWRLPGVSFDLEALKTYYPQGMVKIPCYDEQAFADAICRLLDDPVHYAEEAQKAYELILKVWDWKKRSERVWAQVGL